MSTRRGATRYAILVCSLLETDNIDYALRVQGMLGDISIQELTVRHVEANDLNKEAMQRIDRSAFGDDLLNIWSLTPFLRHGHVLGLFLNESMKGFVILIKDWDEPSHAHIAEMAIDKDSQGRGYGSHLLTNALSYLKMIGISSVSLTVDPNNVRALHLYRDKCGFKFVEYRRNEYGEGRDRLYLRLNLCNLVKSRPNEMR
ncbi:MAG: N-acetyltransferase [Methanomassiliicoccus sp.]|nr:N-acetyltransferase [Methanomassiliicoccus sp.]